MINSKELLNRLINNNITCDEFYNLIKSEPRYVYITSEQGDYWQVSKFNDNFKIPCNGVYIMFENDNKKERIVRIGINNQNNNRLISRIIGNHYMGEGGSSFRDLVAKALDVDNPKDIKVLDYLRKNISFALIQVENYNERKEIEKLLIELFAKHNWQNASKTWQGSTNNSDDVVWASGLWNKDDVPRNLVKLKIKTLLKNSGYDTIHSFTDTIISMLKDYKKRSLMPTPLSKEDKVKYGKDIDLKPFNNNICSASQGWITRDFAQIAKSVLEENLFDEL